LRGQLALSRSLLGKERGDVMDLESELRCARDRVEDLERGLERRDETIAHLTTMVQSQERLAAAEGQGADTFEEVLAEVSVATEGLGFWGEWC
jgi:hypothetical protein